MTTPQPEQPMRTCKKCNEEKLLGVDFPKYNCRGRTYYHWVCRACKHVTQRKQRTTLIEKNGQLDEFYEALNMMTVREVCEQFGITSATYYNTIARIRQLHPDWTIPVRSRTPVAAN